MLPGISAFWNEAILLESDRRMSHFAASEGASSAWERWLWGAVVVMFLHRYGNMVVS
jgi:hypothetical protein